MDDESFCLCGKHFQVRERMGRASRSLASRFSWDEAAGRYLALYERLR